MAKSYYSLGRGLSRAEAIAGWCYLPFYLVLLSAGIQYAAALLHLSLSALTINIVYFSINLLFVLLGVIAGMIAGAIPGVNGPMAIALCIPLSYYMSPVAAIGFLVFTLLYTPCVAAMATIRRELNSTVKTAGVVLMQCAVAWCAAFIAYAAAGGFV